MNIKYAIIPGLAQSPVMGSEARTKDISSSWYGLNTRVRKSWEKSLYLMGWIENDSNPGKFAIQMDLDYMLNVTTGFNTGYLFQLYGQDVNGQERAAINAKLNAAVGGKIQLSEIIPASWTLYTEQQLIDLGWFPSE